MAYSTLVITEAIIAEFREFYDEFADTTKWSDAKVRKALNISLGEIGGCGCSGWGEYLPAYSIFQRGLFALAAHNLTFDKLASDAVAVGGVASTPYAASQKTVRDESVTYVIPGSGYYDGSNLDGWENMLSLTPYGLLFLHLRQRAGMGAICV